MVDPTLIMGGKNSVQDFDVVMSSHVRGCVFHRYDLFSKDPKKRDFNLRLLFSYLDDFMCAARTLAHALEQFAFFTAIGEYLGLVFSPSKMEPPLQEQCLLGVIFNTLHKIVALKSGKPQKVKDMLVKFASSRWWSAKQIEEVMGNLIWVSLVLPKLRAFTTPFILFLLAANRSPDLKVDRWTQPLVNESAADSLKFLIYLLELDPQCSVYRFLSLWPTKKVFPFSDASGWEIGILNPSPGCLGGFFFDKRAGVKFAFSIPWQTILELLPEEFKANFSEPHINYLETFSAFILVAWLVTLFPKLVFRKRIIIKLDSQVAIAWFANGRCPTLPVHRLIQTFAILEWKYSCVITPIYVKSKANPADKLTRNLGGPGSWVTLNHPPGSYFKIRLSRVPYSVLRLFMDSITGRLNYKKFLGSKASLLAYNRQSRFLHPVIFIPPPR